MSETFDQKWHRIVRETSPHYWTPTAVPTPDTPPANPQRSTK